MKILFKNSYFLISIALLFFAASYFLLHPFEKGVSPIVIDFQKKLNEKEHRLITEMNLLAKRAEKSSYNQLFKESPAYYNTLLANDGLALLIYENDTLKFWNDNSIAVENWIKEVCLDTKMVKLSNGWFEVMRPHTNAVTSKTIIGLLLIKNEYPYQNKYLTNAFQKDFSVPPETTLTLSKTATSHTIKNREGDFLFSLKFNASDSISIFTLFALVLNLIAFCCIVLFIKKLSFHFANRIGKNYAVLCFIIIVLFLRYLTLITFFPECFYIFDLFKPSVYADANAIWLSSLGDVLINTLLLIYILFIAINNWHFSLISSYKKTYQKAVLFFLFIAFFILFQGVNYVFISIIKNSNISFSINNFFSLTIYSYIGIFIIALLLFTYFLMTDKLIAILKNNKLMNLQTTLLFIAAYAIHLITVYLISNKFDFFTVTLPLILTFCIFFIKRKQIRYPFSGVILLVLLLSLYAVHVFIKHVEIKEKQNRKVYAEKIAAENDPIAELLFQDIEKRLQTDTILMSLIKAEKKFPGEFEKRLRQNYFSGYWEKYDVRIALFDSLCTPVIKAQNAAFDNNLYFDDLIIKTGTKAHAPNFYSLNNASGKISYLAKLPFLKSIRTTTIFGTLYIELDAKFISDEIGFPELLLDRNVGLSHELIDYAYAKYKNNRLITQYGKYSYSGTGLEFDIKKRIFSFVKIGGFDHLLYRPDLNTLIVLSKPNGGLIAKITFFSYLFTFFSLLLLLILFSRQLYLGSFLKNFSLKYRIQVLLVSIVLASLALFGGGTIYYINQQFENKNRENISEKIQSVLMEIENKLAPEKVLNADMADYSAYIMKKLSSVFFTDINLYDAAGNLYASSQSKIFDEGLTSKKINPEAFLQIAILGKTEFIHDERIGKLNYLSAYVPLKNVDGKLLAYLNLPYFAKQSELEKEISGFLVAIINIYVLLFALSIITAIFISSYVTKPLKLIQEKLSNIKLGKANEPIEWEDNDEIGSLVSEYNRMIAELAKSADLLAKSERESAWREMAKQVAHEIKNPLTPMKLSVQHLKRIWEDNAPDMDQKIHHFTNKLIEQIDTLSTIATEFANFAKMPKATIETLNVQYILLSSIALFEDIENLNIEFKNEITKEVFVLADKEQLLRVFNNLLKNAIQAIPENKKGEIKVALQESNKNIIIRIADNGSGINAAVIDKIFVPNFTTKTGGMGLGLAIVKNIVDGIGGTIWFETVKEKGSIFYVSLPCIS